MAGLGEFNPVSKLAVGSAAGAVEMFSRGTVRMSVITTQWGYTTRLCGLAPILNLIGVVTDALAASDMLNKMLNGKGYFE